MSSGFQFGGAVGAIHELAYIEAKTIAFVDSDPDTITDSGDGFVDAGFVDTDEITVITESTTNDGDYTIDGAVVVGVITLDAGDALSAEIAGQNVIIYKTDIGDQIGGVSDFSVSVDADMLETSNFANEANDQNWETSIPGMIRSKATASKLWSTDTTDVFDLQGKLRMFRFYDADIYRQAVGYISSIGVPSEVSDLVRDNIQIVIVGPITEVAVP